MIKIVLKVLEIPLVIYFLEIITHIYLFSFSLDSYLYTTLMPAIALGGIITMLLSLLKGRWQKIITAIVLFLLGAFFSAMMVYYQIFHNFFLWNTIGMAGEVTAFYRETWTGIKNNWYMIVTALVPFIIYLVISRKHDLRLSLKPLLVTAAVSILAAVGSFAVINSDSKTVKGFQSDTTIAYYQYGVTASTGIDLHQTIFGAPENSTPVIIIDPDRIGKTDVMVSEGKVILKNIIEMDEEALLAASPNDSVRNATKYFLSREASEQNDYTGMFAGKNLIFLTLEGFSYKAISQELTPTLYKMYHEGFMFTNFYDPMWGGSTATGEYANMTGNFHTSASCIAMSASTTMASAMGNLFKKLDYNTYAFHNGTSGYYSRNKALPNFGYNIFKAVDSGLNLESDVWPNSDYEMAVASIDDYINSDKPFHTYYMTISGHTYYSFSGNVMSRRHRDEVSKLNYSEEVRAYIATEIEVENMLTYLCKRLEEAGKLEDTVFAMCCDHYPYGLSDESLAELYGVDRYAVRANFDVFRNAFILWSASMEEPVVVDKPCCSIDILPTIANLFGCSFDSRFIMGTDIFSSLEGLAIINTHDSRGGFWNWRTPQGTYYSVSNRFEKSETCTLADDQIQNYVTSINSKLENMKTYSYMILEKNYYSNVFNRDGTARFPAQE